MDEDEFLPVHQLQSTVNDIHLEDEEDIVRAVSIDCTPPFKTHTNVLRQSGYLVSVMSERDFILRGGKLLDYGIYYINQEYNVQSPHNETVALVGVPMLHVPHFFEPQSDLIEQIKTLPELSYISDIHTIHCENICEILRKFKEFFDHCESHYLLLLNIEPKGEGRYRKIYPTPRFTLPGGTMEECDSNDFLQCALREFQEETHIELTDNYTLIQSKKIIRDIRKKKKQKFDIFTRSSSSNKPTKIVSLYFAVRIKC
jgi:hypothetical protein